MATQRLATGVLWTLVAAMTVASVAFSGDEASVWPPAPSKEMRVQMALVHERMAACLRSDKAFVDCRSEMMKSCREMMGGQGCPMMGKGMGMGTHRPMMQQPPIIAPKDK